MENPWLLPHASLAYFALTMTIISLWIKRSTWIWGGFLLFAFVLGYFAKLIEPVALAPIGALLVLHTFLKGNIRGLARFLLVFLAVSISVGLWFHLFPGFHNWRVLSNAQISPKAYPFSLYLNFDKPFIGIFVLALGFPLVKDWKEFTNVLKTALPLAAIGVTILVALSLYSGLIQWDPKFPSIFWLFLVENLLFVAIPEEAFLRGFVQNEFFRGFGGKGALSNVTSVLLTALLFAALHYRWVPSISFLVLVFAAGVIYGSIYQYTRSLEASILTHWIFNLTHILFFTYPALKLG